MEQSHFGITRRVFIILSLAAVLLSGVIVAGSRVANGAPVPARNSKNTLTIGWSIETKTLDPAGNSQNPDIWVQVNIFDRLVRVAPNGITILPDLATKWKMSNGGKAYTFTLRK